MTCKTPIGLRAARISTVWASRYAALLRCPLSEAAAAAGQPPLIPQSPRAAIGTAIHSLFARCCTEEGFDFSDQRLITEWEMAMKGVEEFLSRSPFMTGMLPLTRSIPNLGLIRARTLLRLAESADQRAPQPSAEPRGRGRKLANPTNTVVGIPDKFDWRGDGLTIVDFKTGAADSKGSFTEDYRMQLRLYAALYNVSHGQWPVRLELQWLDGSREEIDFSSTDCERLLARADKLAQQLKKSTEDIAHDRTRQIQVGTPSKAACRFCAYRPGCPAYLASALAGTPPLECDVTGNFVGSKQFGNGEYLVELTGATGRIRIRNLKRIDHIEAALSSAIPGKPIIVFNVGRSEKENSLFSPTSFTAVHCYDSR